MTKHSKDRKAVVGNTYMQLVWVESRGEWELCVGLAYEGGLDRTAMPELEYSNSYEKLARRFEEIKKKRSNH